MTGIAIQALNVAWEDFCSLLHPDISAVLSTSHWSQFLDFRDPRWLNEELPWSHKRGVYAFLALPSEQPRNEAVVYIGKATMDSSFGTRVWSHVWPKNQDHRVMEGRVLFTKMEPWGHEATHVVALSFPDEYVALAAALEEWLIERIKPSGNTMGVKRHSVRT